MTWLNQLQDWILSILEEKGEVTTTELRNIKIREGFLQGAPLSWLTRGIQAAVRDLEIRGIVVRERRGRQWVVRLKEVA